MHTFYTIHKNSYINITKKTEIDFATENPNFFRIQTLEFEPSLTCIKEMHSTHHTERQEENALISIPSNE